VSGAQKRSYRIWRPKEKPFGIYWTPSQSGSGSGSGPFWTPSQSGSGPQTSSWFRRARLKDTSSSLLSFWWGEKPRGQSKLNSGQFMWKLFLFQEETSEKMIWHARILWKVRVKLRTWRRRIRGFKLRKKVHSLACIRV